MSAPTFPTGSPQARSAPTLARRVGFPLLAIYGVGDIVGSGIYGTIGVAAGVMGNAVWLAFAASMVAAMLTGLTYASISSRYPRAAGAAYVAHRAFRLPALSYAVGLAVLASGLTSIATASNVFAENISFLAGFGAVRLWIAGFLVLLMAVNLWGIRESMLANLACTLIEVAGLIFIVVVSASHWGKVDYLEMPPGSLAGRFDIRLLLSGAVLTFYSFVGFEDMINVAEEVREPERAMPRAIVTALLVASILYVAVSVSAVSVVPYADLANRDLGAPLSQITRRAAPWLGGWVFGAITLFAVANTALLNSIMGSRLVFGMACQGLLPRSLSAVHPKLRTPHVAILILTGVALALALAGTIPDLARATSVLLLLVFMAMHAALVAVKLRRGEPTGRFEVPMAVPLAGFAVCLLLLLHARAAELTIASSLLAAILLLYLFHRPRPISQKGSER